MLVFVVTGLYAEATHMVEMDALRHQSVPDDLLSRLAEAACRGESRARRSR